MKNFSAINRMKSKGFSLIEILLVIGIIAVLAIAAFIIFPQVQASGRANTEQSNIMTIAAGTKSLFNGRYTGATATPADITGTVNQARIIPASMNGGSYLPAATITSAWGGAVTVAGRGTQFNITYIGVPVEVCLKLLPGLLQNFEALSVAAAPLSRTSTGGDIVTACNTNTGSPVDVILTSN